MVRKKLGDVLRQEVQKGLDANGDGTGEHQTIEVEVIDVTAVTTTDEPPATAPTEDPAQKELIADLKKQLQDAHRHEKSLAKQITELEAHLKQEQTTIQLLQTQLERANQTQAELDKVKAELEEARAVILQLAEVNNAAKASKAQSAPPSEPKPSASKPSAPKAQPAQPPHPHYLEPDRLPKHSIHSHPDSSSKFSEFLL